MLRPKQRSQAVVEFGIIALLFTLLVFAVIDFGLLLNTWLAVSSGSRDIARSASVGKPRTVLQAASLKLNLPSIDPGTKLCCDSTSAVEVKIEYLQTVNGPVYGAAAVGSTYPYPDVDHQGSCPDPAPPAPPTCHPLADDLVRVTVIAHGAQVITPLVRPFFGCTNGVNPDCHVELHSTTTMRFEGREF